uniref:Amino acid permease/ SLC12A domain-containing protein n=1 Tax=Chromulina nebulosa TaxID=96789 RepID=A0A7S0XE27_9STRA
MRNGRSMWRFICLLSMCSVLLIIIYCFGSLGWVNISRYGPFDDDKVHHVWFNGGMSAFLCNLASGTTAGFGGIESLALMISYMKDPLRNFQEGAISSVLTLFFCNIMLLIVMTSLPLGLSYTSQQTYPMNYGYDLIFQWPDVVSSVLVIPANFAMGFGFFLPYGKLLQCLADSQLAPEFLGLKDEKNPSKAILICSFFGFLLCILQLIDENLSTKLNYIAILCGFITYFSILIGHITVLVKHQDMVRSFRSPFGIYGSIYAIIVFALGSIGSIGFLDDNHITIIVTTTIVIVLSTYYYVMFIKTQKLSNEENKSLFKLHVINFNNNLRKKLFSKKNKVKSTSADKMNAVNPFNNKSSSNSSKGQTSYNTPAVAEMIVCL